MGKTIRKQNETENNSMETINDTVTDLSEMRNTTSLSNIRGHSTMHGSSAGNVLSGGSGSGSGGAVISSPNQSEIDQMATIVPTKPQEE